MTCLGYFIELAESFPKLFRPVLDKIVHFMIMQMQNTELENGTRHTCLELLLTLLENAPGLLRKHPTFSSQVIPIMLSWMSEIDDDREWYETDNLMDDDNESNETVGEQSMDRLAQYLGPNLVLPICFSIIPVCVGSPEWQKRHAGLRCISAIGEGCHKLMEHDLDKVLAVVLPHLADPHPRVRHAACNALGQMCTDFAPRLQEQYHKDILSKLIPVLDNSTCIRVQSYAAAVLVNFSEGVDKAIMVIYLDMIVPKLLNLMNSPKQYAQEQAMTTLAQVADSAANEFKKFYSQLMPTLLNFLTAPASKETRLLKGKAIDCASLIALAVGKELFAPDAMNFINILQSTQQTVITSDDPQSSYLLTAWARVCKIMGAEFEPFLEYVIPPLVKSAQLKPDIVAFTEGQEPDTDKYSQQEGWDMIDMDGKVHD